MIKELITSKVCNEIEENAELKSDGNIKSLGNVISFVDEREKQRDVLNGPFLKWKFDSTHVSPKHCKMHFDINQDFGWVENEN